MSSNRRSDARTRRGRWAVVALCALIITFDGYDLIAYGTTVGALRQEWGISGSTAGMIASVALVGMLFGALLVGTVTDILGRRVTMIGAVTFFSIMMPLCAFAPNPEIFASLRFAAGVGLGGVMPIASALVTEYAPPRRRNLTYVVMQSGYAVGGIVAAAAAIWVIPNLGWQAMYLIGGAPLVLVVPVAVRYLPESLEYLLVKGRTQEAQELAGRLGVPVPEVSNATGSASAFDSVRVLFAPQYLRSTLLFWAMTFCALLLVFGVSTWLPEIMRAAGYSLGSALTFLLVFNLGSIIGSLCGGLAADRWNSRVVIAVTFALGSMAILALTTEPQLGLLYLLFALGGYGSIGAQNLINPFVTRHYPPHARATGVGFSLGIGRLGAIVGPILGGVIVDSPLGPGWNFYLFALVGSVGLLAALALPITSIRAGRAVMRPDTFEAVS